MVGPHSLKTNECAVFEDNPCIKEDGMEAIIKSRLTMVEDEVKELHPLLKELFQKLPNIIDLDYTMAKEKWERTSCSQRNTTFWAILNM